MARGQYIPTFASGDSSAHGLRMVVTGTTNGAADVLHTTTTTLDGGGVSLLYIDYVTVDVHNTDTVQHTLYLLWGGTTEPRDLVRVDIPPGLPVMDVIVSKALAGGATVKAYADAASKITVGVSVNRYQRAAP